MFLLSHRHFSAWCIFIFTNVSPTPCVAFSRRSALFERLLRNAMAVTLRFCLKHLCHDGQASLGARCTSKQSRR
ncbi:hypothetical protein BC835DRAFT_1379569 [Cytidiella melzeri]|nr:hypothetical protein BC835DRAFT_1379569 [Cytidiella melzeri]